MAQRNALRALRLMEPTTTRWGVADAATVTKNDEDAKLTRPMHVITGQRISLFLVFSFLVAYVPPQHE
jgi:hypothetical protein